MKRIFKIMIIINLLCISVFGQESTINMIVKRSYVLHLPRNYENKDQFPLVIVLHGANWTASQADNCYGFTAHGDTTGYIVVYPQGVNKSWNGEMDVPYISSLIDTLCVIYKIDKHRIYILGHSNGGGLVYILACKLSSKIAAFASVSATMNRNNAVYYEPRCPIPLLIIRGTRDDMLPYQGIPESGVISTDSLVNFWKSNNKVKSLKDSVMIPDINKNDGSTVIKYIYGENKSEIVFYKIINGGHDIPDWCHENAMGNTNRDINTPKVLWDFFKNHSLN